MSQRLRRETDKKVDDFVGEWFVDFSCQYFVGGFGCNKTSNLKPDPPGQSPISPPVQPPGSLNITPASPPKSDEIMAGGITMDEAVVQVSAGIPGWIVGQFLKDFDFDGGFERRRQAFALGWSRARTTLVSVYCISNDDRTRSLFIRSGLNASFDALTREAFFRPLPPTSSSVIPPILTYEFRSGLVTNQYEGQHSPLTTNTWVHKITDQMLTELRTNTMMTIKRGTQTLDVIPLAGSNSAIQKMLQFNEC